MSEMTHPEIRAAYDSGDTEAIDREACEVMQLGVEVSWEERRSTPEGRSHAEHGGFGGEYCLYCNRDDRRIHYCTRYTTDLTSAAELELAAWPIATLRTINIGGAVTVESAQTTIHERFTGPNEALNRTTAALYARAWELENS